MKYNFVLFSVSTSNIAVNVALPEAKYKTFQTIIAVVWYENKISKISYCKTDYIKIIEIVNTRDWQLEKLQK